ncbi:MAG: hypothetical protein JJT85_03960 [Chromatiales bacterium]|nr:hypothetical protein [Chromatiales bacterium]
MTSRAGGHAWVFGDDINTDLLAPGLYFKAPLEELSRHCLEAVNPGFAGSVQPGDVIVAGRNFGMGSAREQAAQVLVQLGVGAVLARSFGRIFYRNAINFGLPVLLFPQAGEIIPGQRLEVDARRGTVRDLAMGQSFTVPPLPEHLLGMLEAGGLMPWLHRRLAARREAAQDV